MYTAKEAHKTFRMESCGHGLPSIFCATLLKLVNQTADETQPQFTQVFQRG